MRTKIIYEDAHIIIAYKPAGLATQTAKVGQADMVSELKNHLAGTGQGKAPYLGIVHRLDQPVEGLLAFAKTKEAAARLTAQLGKGTLHKQYYGVICGQVAAREGELVDYLYKTPENRAKIVTGQQSAFPHAKKAVLQYTIKETLSSPEAISLADIHIDTGRFHQIRAQMAHASMPLLGDGKYGDENALEQSRRMGIRNVALCAYTLTLTHPDTGRPLSFSVRPQGIAFANFKELQNASE